MTVQADTPPPVVYDVAIAGCGPVGAIAANLLAKAGLRVLVVEQAREPHPLPRAVHLDHEMMRIFQGGGLIDRLEPLMRATQGHVHIGADGGVIRYLGAAGQPKRFGWANDYFFYQPELEAELRDALARFPNADLRLGVRLDGLSQDNDGVTLDLWGDDSRESVRARYLIGCDGASSSVRKALGVKLDDLQFDEPWLVVDAEVDGPISFPDFPGLPEGPDLQQLSVMLCDPRRPTTIVPGRGNHRRWEFMLLPGESDMAMMQPERVKALVAPWVRAAEHRIVRAATYRFHALVAEQWQVGRVFLAGDAAHQTPPFFGQGMCHGIRDVANLAWKLPLVLSGQADPALLETYQPEREPHVRGVIGAAVAAGEYICMLDPEAAARRDYELRERSKAAAPTTAADLIPPIRAGVVAGDGAGERFIQPLVEAGGRRMLLDDATGGGFVLIARSPEALEALDRSRAAILAGIGGKAVAVGEGGIVDVEGHLETWFKARAAAAVLVRPDGYVYALAEAPADIDDVVDSLAADLQLTGRGAAPGQDRKAAAWTA